MDTSLDDILGQLQDIGPKIRDATNQLAMLQAQNSDVANGRWTLNNVVAHWNTMEPNARLTAAAIVAAVAYYLVNKA